MTHPARRATLIGWAVSVWRYLRTVSGDDAYERYCLHAARHGETPALTRRAHFAERERRKWNGVTRCC